MYDIYDGTAVGTDVRVAIDIAAVGPDDGVAVGLDDRATVGP